MKRHAWVVVAVAAVSALSVACSAPTANQGQPATGAITADSSCHEQTIAEYCAERTCSTFDEVAAYARKPEAPGTFMRYDIGTCGDYRFIHLQEGMGDGTDYYDASGKLVSTSMMSDTPRCGREPSATQIGVAPTCEKKVLEHGDYSKTSVD